MNKYDLKPGMLVVTREPEKYLVCETNDCELYFASQSEILEDVETDLNDEMRDCDDEMYDIMKVYSTPTEPISVDDVLDTDYRKLIWERPQEYVLTMDQIAAKFGVSVDKIKIKK